MLTAVFVGLQVGYGLSHRTPRVIAVRSKVKVRRVVLRIDGEPRGAVSDTRAQRAVMLKARKKVRTRSGPESVLIEIDICSPPSHLSRWLLAAATISALALRRHHRQLAARRRLVHGRKKISYFKSRTVIGSSLYVVLMLFGRDSRTAGITTNGIKGRYCRVS